MCEKKLTEEQKMGCALRWRELLVKLDGVHYYKCKFNDLCGRPETIVKSAVKR